MKNKLPGLDVLERLFVYVPDTGKLVRKTSIGRAKAGEFAGSKDKEGRVNVRIYGKLYMASRIAWKMFYGKDPQEDKEIDHVNNIKNDDRVCNLREATRSENQCNTGVSSANTSGFKGVYYEGKEKVFRAEICSNGKRFQLGRFLTANQAFMARAFHAVMLHKEFSR